MCGIAGIVGFGSPISPYLLAGMNKMLVHRGPDDGGEWLDASGRVGLANRRLAILDLSPAGHQPMHSLNGDHSIAYNGEIYNYLELRDELASLGHQFKTKTDTEIILGAYDQWGEDCVQRFNGMFAFAIWDARRSHLFAARDRFGEKPFYYHRSPERLIFASEIKALLLDKSIRRQVDEEALARYLLLAEVDTDERTFFAGIRQLAPAHTMTADLTGKIVMRRYWDLDLAATRKNTDRAEIVSEFDALFTDAVRLRLRSDVPVGSSLSGGLDSSSIACTIDRLLRHEGTGLQKTFSARYRSSAVDEGKFIDAVTAKTNIEAHHVWIQAEDLAEELDAFVYHQDQPVAHTSQFAQWKVMSLARANGVTVLLDGQGADEVLGGYPSPTFGYRYAELLRSGDVPTFFRELVQFRRNHGSAHRLS